VIVIVRRTILGIPTPWLSVNERKCREILKRSGNTGDEIDIALGIKPAPDARNEHIANCTPEVVSLRDQFAMAALSWDRLEYLLPGGGERDPEEVAEACYELADAMLKARNRPKQP